MEYTVFLGAIVFLALTLIVTKVFARKAFFLKNKISLNAVMYFVILALLSWHFYQRHMTVGLVAVLLGGIAIGKYLLDVSKTDEKK